MRKITTYFYLFDNNNLLPVSFDNFFTSINKIHNYNTRLASKSTFYLPKVRTNYGASMGCLCTWGRGCLVFAAPYLKKKGGSISADMSTYPIKQDAHRVNKSVMEMQKHLECSICLEMMSNPYSTKCNHQFCWECISNFIQRCGKKSTNKWFCPLCKSPVSRRSLTANPRLAEIINAVHSLKNAVLEDTQCTDTNNATKS